MLEITKPENDRGVLDFTDRPCSASWSNSEEYLPCPSELAQISSIPKVFKARENCVMACLWTPAREFTRKTLN